MKKIINIIILLVVCLLPTVVADAKVNYEYDWDISNSVFLNKNGKSFNVLNYVYNLDADNIYVYDENGEYVEEKTFINYDDSNLDELIGSEDFEAYKNLIYLTYNNVFDDDSKITYYVSYYSDSFHYYDFTQSTNITIKFEDDLSLTRKLLGKKYDVYLNMKSLDYEVNYIYECNNYYVVYYYDPNVDSELISVLDSKYKNIFSYTINNDIYFYNSVYVYDDLIYFFADNVTIDIYKIDGTKYDTIKIDYVELSDTEYDSCDGFGIRNIYIKNNEMLLFYQANRCATRLEMIDDSYTDISGIAPAPLESFILKYTLDYDIDTVFSSNGEFTYETKEDEDGKSYVELKITPKDGYSVEDIIVTDIYGNRIEVTNNKFYKPLNDVKIEVKYIQGEYLPIPDTLLNVNVWAVVFGILFIIVGCSTLIRIMGDNKVKE